MTNQSPSIDKLINDARKAIEAERIAAARPMLREAARLAPDDPRPWLLLAGVAETPRERRTYLAQARRLDEKGGLEAPARPAPVAPVIARPRPAAPPDHHPKSPPTPSQLIRRGMALAALVLLVALAAAMIHPDGRTVLADVVGRVSMLTGAGKGAGVATVPTAAVVAEAPPTALPTNEPLEVVAPSPTSPPVFPTKGVLPGGGSLPTWTPTSVATPTLAPTMTPSPTPEPSPTAEPIPLSVGAVSPRPAGVGEAERWIAVNLSTQTLVAYEGDAPVFETLVSSGLPQWPTVTGQYRTYMKYESQTMNGYLLGYDYYLPDVPYVMYFFEDYAIHGTYWHSSFGTPMSHGCVNVSTPDAGWLFNWAPVGTLVNVTY